jgi:hypothetical protein
MRDENLPTSISSPSHPLHAGMKKSLEQELSKLQEEICVRQMRLDQRAHNETKESV